MEETTERQRRDNEENGEIGGNGGLKDFFLVQSVGSKECLIHYLTDW